MDFFGVAVVKVVVTAIDRVGLRLDVRQAADVVIGVQQHPEAVALQKKAGVAQPCNGHEKTPPYFDFIHRDP